MRITTAWRLASLWLVLPLALLAGQLYTHAVFPSGEFYPLSDEVLAFEAIALIYPLIAASAAISAARMRQSGLLEHPTHRRSRLVIALNLSSAAAVVALVSVLATIVLYSLRASRSFSIEWPVLGYVLISSVSYALLGTAFGLRLRPVLAITLAVITPYLLIAIPPALSTIPWPRHLTSVNSSCCSIDQKLSSRAVTAFVLFHLAMVLLASSAIVGTGTVRRRREFIVASFTGVATLVAGALVAAPLPYGPTAHRAGEPHCEQTAGFALCLWPEHEPARATAAPVLTKVRAIASATGVELPSRLVERPQEAWAWPVALVDLPPTDEATLTASIAGALFPSDASCTTAPDPTGAASSPATARFWWNWRLLGDPQDPGTDSDATARFRRIQHLDARSQGAEINALSREYRRYCQAHS